MAYDDTMREINNRREQMMKLRGEMRELQKDIEPQRVSDYTFDSSSGEVTLSELFGSKDTLFVIHNMGKGCTYCTQWADGFNGVLNHLEDRAAFAVASPDAPGVQEEFAASRGWQFKMISQKGTSFAEDMGYYREFEGTKSFWPGVSVFRKSDEDILRVSDTVFGPGDDFNAVWNLFDMIPEGPNGWEPRYSYA